MRTTLTLDPDVFAKIKAEARQTGKTFKDVVNQALRRGLASKPSAKTLAYEAPARDLGLKPGFSLDCIGRLLAELDQQEYGDPE